MKLFYFMFKTLLSTSWKKFVSIKDTESLCYTREINIDFEAHLKYVNYFVGKVQNF
jgi:hypothetical protein